jgi:hypothetical protein
MGLEGKELGHSTVFEIFVGVQNFSSINDRP